MDKIQKTAQQALTTWQASPQIGLDDNRQISVYEKGEVSAEAFAQGCQKIRSAFPDLPNEWYQILNEAIDEESFTDEKFRNAVWNLIKTCVYKKPTIADLLGYDKTIKIYTYNELWKLYGDQYHPNAKRDPIYEDYVRIVEPVMGYVRKIDFNNVRFKKFEPPKNIPIAVNLKDESGNPATLEEIRKKNERNKTK